MNRDLFSIFYHQKISSNIIYSNPLEAEAIYANRRVNLLTQEEETSNLDYLLNRLKQVSLYEDRKDIFVCHLTYELGAYFEGLGNLIADEQLLAVIIRYQDYARLEVRKARNIDFGLELKEFPPKEEYSKAVDQITRHLEAGDCYQVNYTGRFHYSFSKEVTHREFLRELFSKGQASAFAHGTYIAALNKLILSNSPECLFSLGKEKIRSMPIKGTLPEGEKAWDTLRESEKDDAELMMITDLLRNDLTRIELLPAKVKIKKAPLRVPGLIHQFSLVEVPYTSRLSLFALLKGVFPGGSITGAPKRRVMSIIDKLERGPRNFYCGSTVLLHRSLKAASINIRTADIDLVQKSFTYGSGGGITLLSKTNAEYEEMLAKVKSFQGIFT